MLGIPLDFDNGDGQNIWTETAKENSSGNVKEGKIPGLLRQTKTMKEIPFGNLNEGKIPREHHKTKTMKEIPHGNVNEGK
ncbi:hypothetical protein A2U01_0077505, partial [Trifolium medium]|nr:hypothetical protein [Trifolium medium]